MLHNWVERANQLFVASYKIVFFVFGSVGNSLFIFLVLRNQQLKSKSSYLQCIQCSLHILCLLSTLVDVSLAFPDIQLGRQECFSIMAPFVLIEAAQAVVTLELVLDVLMLVRLPWFYKKFATWKYLLVSLIVPSITGSVFTVWGFSDLDDEEIYFCNPTSSLHLNASKNYTRCIVIINSCTVYVFLVLIAHFHSKSHKATNGSNLDSTKVMKRLQLSVAIFLCSWYITIFTYFICIACGVEGEELHFTINNMSFFVCLSYSQTFYVILYKSTEYRKVFFHLIGIRKPIKDINTTKASSSRVAVIHSPVLI